MTMGDFKVGVSVGVYCTKCTLNTGVNTNFEITQCVIFRSEVGNVLRLCYTPTVSIHYSSGDEVHWGKN
jgi:hypothetical protein